MIENYEDKNIEQTLDAIAEFDAESLQQFLVYEREHKDRKGVVTAIQDELITVEAPRSGYYGGLWFDEPGEKVVRDNSRVQTALEETRLTQPE